MSNHIQIADEIVGESLAPAERTPVLCEIVRKAESLQVRAVAVLYADGLFRETHGSWSAFCKSEFGWDDSYASRMASAARMILEGTSITTEAQARVLSKVDPDEREEVLEKAREKSGGSEPSASVISEVISSSKSDAVDTDMLDDQRQVDEVIAALRAALNMAKALDPRGPGRWLNMPHFVSDLKNAANALKHARPHGPCDDGDGKHDKHCLCGGSGWLPKHVLERPKGE
jgi:hypothetical protein